MRLDQVAIQLYTLRKHIRTREALEDTLRRLRSIGYRALEIGGLDWALIAPEDLAALCARLDLTICATHEAPDTILHHPDQVIARLRALGCRYAAYPFPGGVDLNVPAQVQSLIEGLETSGRALSNAGMVLAYHNHHHEFRKQAGRLLLELIFEGTQPPSLQSELDTYWVQYGGHDPAAWCRRLQGRLPLLHMKDYMINPKGTATFAEIGAGNLDFKRIVADAEASGCEWFVVEQDQCPVDEFDSIAQSLDYISRELAS